jgi:hypothetical protein
VNNKEIPAGASDQGADFTSYSPAHVRLSFAVFLYKQFMNAWLSNGPISNFRQAPPMASHRSS